MFAQVRFIAGFTNATFALLGRKFFRTFGPSFYVSDLFSVAFQGEMRNNATMSDSVTGALIGRLLYGEAGMVTGALLGGKQYEALVAFYFRDGRKGLGQCNPEMIEALKGFIFDNEIQEGQPGPDFVPEPPKRIYNWKKKFFVIFIVLYLLSWLSAIFNGPNVNKTETLPSNTSSLNK